MVRRNKQSRVAQRRAQAKLARELENVTAGQYRPPMEGCLERQHYRYLDDESSLRMLTIIRKQSGALVDFVLVLQRWTFNEWESVSRVDCCWGFCHIHPPEDQTRHEPICRLDTRDDVDRAFRAASERLLEVAATLREQGTG